MGRDHKKELEIKGELGNIFWNQYANEVTHYDAKTQCKYVYRKFPTDFNSELYCRDTNGLLIAAMIKRNH